MIQQYVFGVMNCGKNSMWKMKIVNKVLYENLQINKTCYKYLLNKNKNLLLLQNTTANKKIKTKQRAKNTKINYNYRRQLKKRKAKQTSCFFLSKTGKKHYIHRV